MNQFYTFLIIIVGLLWVKPAFAQKAVRDSSITIPSISVHYAYQFPGGDLSSRFGNNHNVGGEFTIKLRSGFILGVEGSYLFGTDVKNENSYFKNIRNDHGFVIDGNGQYAEVMLYERGLHIFAFAGYQFTFWSPNPNSGPFIHLGAGFLQHYVRIENPGNVTPQIMGEYSKLYDRLSNGFSATQMIGYRYMGNHNLSNFYIGIEFTQAWTQSRRAYNADDMKQNTDKHLDLLFGIKLGWVIPLYGRAPKDFYYF